MFYCKAVLLILLVSAQSVSAQESPAEQLERKLLQRDNTIIELLERVEALEQRVGVPRASSNDETQSGKDVLPNSGSAAPGAVVIEEGAAERALERSLTRDGALLLATGVLEIEPSFSYSRNEDATPGFVNTGTQILASKIERNTVGETTSLSLRLGLPWDSQLELALPYRRRNVDTVTSINFVPSGVNHQSDSGVGDLRVGFAKTLLRQGLWLPDLVARVSWDTDSGDTGGFDEYRTSLSMIKRQDPLTFSGGLSYEYTSSKDDVQPGSASSLSFGTYIAVSPETSINLIFSGTHQNETSLSGVGVDGSDRDVGVFIIGGSSLVAPGILLHYSTEIGLTDDADDFGLSVSLPIRLDGRLF